MKALKRIAASAVGTLSVLLMMSGCMGLGGTDELTSSPIRTYDYSRMHPVQPTAVIEPTEGTITAVLYPEYAPNTVQNFIDRANDGFYDGKDIFYVLDKSIFMAGSADEKRNSGVTSDGEPIPNEYSVDLWPFKGAICSFSGRAGYGDSRIMVLNERPLSEENVAELRGMVNNDTGEKLLPDELIDAFVEKGVVIDFAGGYTVFAQTIEGMDVIERICSAEVSGEYSMPVEPIYIEKVTINEYHAG